MNEPQSEEKNQPVTGFAAYKAERAAKRQQGLTPVETVSEGGFRAYQKERKARRATTGERAKRTVNVMNSFANRVGDELTDPNTFADVVNSVPAGVVRGVDAIGGMATMVSDQLDSVAPWKNKGSPRIMADTNGDGKRELFGFVPHGTSQEKLTDVGSAAVEDTAAYFGADIDIKDMHTPETLLGALGHGLAQFGVGRAGVGKALGKGGAKRGQNQIKSELYRSALADFSAFDGETGRLSDMLVEINQPNFTKAVVDILASDADDTQLEGRLKNAVEGGILGGAVSSAIQTVKGIRQLARDNSIKLDDVIVDKELSGVLNRGDLSRLKGMLRKAGYSGQNINNALLKIKDVQGASVDGPQLPLRMKDLLVEELGEGARAPIDGFLKGAGNRTGTEGETIVGSGVKEDASRIGQFVNDSLDQRLGTSSKYESEQAARETLQRIGRDGYEAAFKTPAPEGSLAPLMDELEFFKNSQLANQPLKQIAEGQRLDIDALVQQDPRRAAHWLQSRARELADAATDSTTGKQTPQSIAYNQMRSRLLERLEAATPGYKEARTQFGDEFSNMRALDAGKSFFNDASDPYKADRLVDEFGSFTPDELAAAKTSVKNTLQKSLGNHAEGRPPRMVQTNKEPTLDTLERSLGEDGAALAEDLRRAEERTKRNQFISTDGSNTMNKQQASEFAEETVANPIMRGLGQVADRFGRDAALSAAFQSPLPFFSGQGLKNIVGDKLKGGRQAKVDNLSRMLMQDIPVAPSTSRATIPTPPSPIKTTPPEIPRPPVTDNLGKGAGFANVKGDGDLPRPPQTAADKLGPSAGFAHAEFTLPVVDKEIPRPPSPKTVEEALGPADGFANVKRPPSNPVRLPTQAAADPMDGFREVTPQTNSQQRPVPQRRIISTAQDMTAHEPDHFFINGQRMKLRLDANQMDDAAYNEMQRELQLAFDGQNEKYVDYVAGKYFEPYERPIKAHAAEDEIVLNGQRYKLKGKYDRQMVGSQQNVDRMDSAGNKITETINVNEPRSDDLKAILRSIKETQNAEAAQQFIRKHMKPVRSKFRSDESGGVNVGATSTAASAGAGGTAGYYADPDASPEQRLMNALIGAGLASGATGLALRSGSQKPVKARFSTESYYGGSNVTPELSVGAGKAGSSEFVDPNGIPLYHGMAGKLEGGQLRPSEHGAYGAGVYLTPEKHMAERFAKTRAINGGTENVLQAQAKGNFAGSAEWDAKFREGKSSLEIARELQAEGFDGVSVGGEVVVFDPANVQLSKITGFVSDESGNVSSNAAATASGAGVGAVAAQDIDGDGQISMAERAAFAAGGASLGLQGGLIASARKGPGSKTRDIREFLGDESGTFAGEQGAKTLTKKEIVGPSNAIDKAKKMKESGASRDEIWKATTEDLKGTPYIGVYEGIDGKWRFEVSDNQSTILNGKTGNMSEVLKDIEFNEVYPELDKLSVKPVSMKEDQYGVYKEAPFGIGKRIRYNRDLGEQQARSTLAHERQHAVQSLEGFAYGGNPTVEQALQDKQLRRQFFNLAKKTEEAQQRFNELTMPGQEGRAEEIDSAIAILNSLREKKIAGITLDELDDYYFRTAGEVEARNVQSRLEMSDLDRRDTPPWSTQDIADEFQLSENPKASKKPFMIIGAGSALLGADALLNREKFQENGK